MAEPNVDCSKLHTSREVPFGSVDSRLAEMQFDLSATLELTGSIRKPSVLTGLVQTSNQHAMTMPRRPLLLKKRLTRVQK